jgi:hypothetical protein
MSARPDVRRLSAEDLDVLISRSLDGDLSPEDQKLLDEILAADPRAAARRDELAGVVAALVALPAPGAPLGMTARVAANAAGRSSGLAGVWQRLGIFPPPAMVRGIAAVFAIVVIGISVMRSQSERAKQYEQMEAAVAARAADRNEGAVSVFFEEKKKEAVKGAPANASAVAANAPAAPAAPPAVPARKPAELRPEANAPAAVADADAVAGARRQAAGSAAPAPASAELRKLGRASKDEKEAGSETDRVSGRADAVAESQAAPSLASSRDEGAAKRAKTNREMSAPLAVAQAPAGAPAAAAPAAAPAPPVSSPLAWSVSVLGSPGWMLRKAPESVPGRLFDTRCVVSIDASGRVTAVRPSGAPVPKEVDDLLRGLVFVPVASGGKAPLPGEIKIEVRSR